MADASGQSSDLLSSSQETVVSSTILPDTFSDTLVETQTDDSIHGRPAPTESNPVSEEPLPSPIKSTTSLNGTDDSSTDSQTLGSTTEEIKPFIVYAPIRTSSSSESSTSTVFVDVEGSTTASDETPFADTESAPAIMRLAPSYTTTSEDNLPSKSVTASQSSASPMNAMPASQTSSVTNIEAQASDVPQPLFTSATTLGGLYVVSAFASAFETTLPNGDTITSTTMVATTMTLQRGTQQSNEDNIRGAPSPPGPYIPQPNSIPSTAFFKRPAAAAGVFIAVSLVLGCFVWMFFLLRKHRRQVATGKDSKRQTFHAYGSTGVSHRDRGSFMSYDARNWPERFEEDTYSAPSTPIPPPALEPSPAPAWRPGYTHAFGSSYFPEAGPSSPTSPTLDDRHQYTHLSAPLVTATSIISPPPVPSRSPYRPVFNSVHSRGESHSELVPASHMGASAANSQIVTQHTIGSRPPPFAPLTPLSRTLSSNRPRPRALSSSVSAHPYPTNSSLSTISDSSDPNEPHPIVLFRRASDRSTESQPSDIIRSSAYITPSPSSSNGLRKTQEMPRNPFADADSPPSTPLPFVHSQEEGGHVMTLDRGVSLRRNDTLRDRPEHHLSTTPEPSVAERSDIDSGTFGSGFSATPRLALLAKTAENRFGRKSESMSTAETSTGCVHDMLTNPVESELFYSLDFMRATATQRGATPGTAR